MRGENGEVKKQWVSGKGPPVGRTFLFVRHNPPLFFLLDLSSSLPLFPFLVVLYRSAVGAMPKPRKNTGSRNPLLTKGVTKYGRSASYHLSGRYKVKNLKGEAKKPEAPATTKTVTFGKGTREVPVQKAPRFYPAEDVKRPLYVRKPARAPKVRASLQPGTVAIVVSGPHRGKRVVVLKTLPSGLLLVTGIFINFITIEILVDIVNYHIVLPLASPCLLNVIPCLLNVFLPCHERFPLRLNYSIVTLIIGVSHFVTLQVLTSPP